MYSPEVLDQLMALGKKYGALCIADEVMTGFGRTGKLFATLHCTEKPDIIALSKGLTGGMLPMALGFGEGGEQNAPLGRAVIGGLVVATLATLFLVPVAFRLLRRRSGVKLVEDFDAA